MRAARKRMIRVEGHESGIEQSSVNNLVYMKYNKACHDIASYEKAYFDKVYFNKV